METYITIGIALLLGAIVLKVAWKSLKTAIKLICLLAVAGIGLHYFAPEVLDKVISQSQKEEVTAKVFAQVDSLKQQSEKKLVEALGEVIQERRE